MPGAQYHDKKFHSLRSISFGTAEKSQNEKKGIQVD